MYCWQLFSKITMARGTRRKPLEAIRMPGIPFHSALTTENTNEEVEQEDQLSSSQNKGRNADKHIQGLLRLKKDVLGRIVNTAHLAANAENVHREEHAVNA